MGVKEDIIPYVEYIDRYLEEITPRPPKFPEHTYAGIYEYIFRGGKRLRPVIMFLVSEALGKGKEFVKEEAAIVELFHNFTLIHDDIEDNSKLRRGKPTLHEIYGVPLALNIGDALYTYVWIRLLDLEKKVAEFLAENFEKVVRGQGLELWLEANEIFPEDEGVYFELAGNKTSALIASCFTIPFLKAGLPWKEVYEAGLKVGLAFQIRDDYLNLKGEEEKYKKKIGDDITEGKRTLLVIHALKHLPKEKAERLKEILRMHTEDRELINEAISLIEESGAFEKALAVSENFLEEAKAILQRRIPDGEPKRILLEVVDYVVKREK